MIADLSKINFVDFGSKTGDSFKLGYSLGGVNGLGIELRQRMVDSAVDKGFNVLQGDVLDLALPDKSVRFAILNHFLEHLASLKDVKRAIESACRISTDFVYLGGPMFDDDEYLKTLGLRTYWSHWKGHPCHLTLPQLQNILHSLGYAQSTYGINSKIKPYHDSLSSVIHSLESPVDQHHFITGEHPPKPFIKFDRTLYCEWKCIISLNGKKGNLLHLSNNLPAKAIRFFNKQINKFLSR